MRAGRKLALVAVVLGIAMIAGVAFALWSADGGGAGNAKALTAATVTVDTVTGPADLYPGGPAGAVYFTLTNGNPYPITFDKVTAASVDGVAGGIGGSPACATTDLTLSALPITGLSLQVGASTTSGTESISGIVAMESTAPDACQGAVFDISLTLTGSQD